MHASRSLFLFALVWLFFSSTAPAKDDSRLAGNYQPDPQAVERYGPAYRYPQAGWIVLHIEGEPYERGYQHGRLMAPEIAAYVCCFAAVQNHSAPNEGWHQVRRLVNALFLRRYEKEYLEEMKGIADGAAAAGARYDNRPIDFVDIVAINSWPEVDFLDSALEATPTGLEGMRFPGREPRAMPAPTPMHCSAFAATGPATTDGKVVIGHITMFGLYPSNYYNVWIDVKPSRGHRVLIQGYPGGIQSGLDYYLNDAGIVITETTLAQTKFDIDGKSESSRIRQAMQYADTIDKAVEILKIANNGLYTNEWLLADVKTNEIAMFELGTHKSRLWRSGKNEWFGGTEGFYWGCNNTKDLDVRLETIAGVNDRPANMVFCPTDRDKTWQRLYREHKGKIGADFGKLAFTTPPLAAYHSLDAKFTTTDLAKDLKTWALFGPPLGRTWLPTQEERRRYPEIRPLVSNPWTILHAAPPNQDSSGAAVAMDVPERLNEGKPTHDERSRLANKLAWHGTIFPKTDADVWLATAFANYEHLVAQENSFRDHGETKSKKDRLTTKERDRLAVWLHGFKSAYLASARATRDVPLSQTRSDIAQSEWYQIASGKGVLLLHELRKIVGRTAFEQMMDDFGRAHAGKDVTTAGFQAHAERVAGKKLDGFFHAWLNQTGLPRLELGEVSVVPLGNDRYQVVGEVRRQGLAADLKVAVHVETSEGAETKVVDVNAPQVRFDLSTAAPRQITIDKDNLAAKANGGLFTVMSFHAELPQSLIVYHSGDEVAANREAAEALQRAIRERHSNLTLPIKTDQSVTDEELASHHLLLVGWPNGSPQFSRLAKALPISLGQRSFTIGKETYAHPGSAVVAVAENPLNPRFSVVLIAGLSPESTLHAPTTFIRQGNGSAEVLILPNKGEIRALVVPAKELVRELRQPDAHTTRKVARPAGAQ
jgi:hypothetical protein